MQAWILVVEVGVIAVPAAITIITAALRIGQK
jgi:hypothetical protein